MRRGVTLSWVLGTVLALTAGAATSPIADSGGDSIPAPFAPFEHMVGGWKGTGIPAANKLKGWPEKHMWAWKFAKGSPVGMTVSFEGNKVLTKGQLTFDARTKQYRLEGTDAAGKPLSFAGAMDSTGKALVLNRQGMPPGEKEKLTIRPNANLIRYVVWVDRQEKGAPQFSRVIENNMGKEGESFASGGTAADLPKCIVTGGAAAMSVSFEGKTYPLCCSGCKDEFQDNPAKYVKKALLNASTGGKTTKASKSSALAKDDGSFGGLVEDEKPREDTPAATKPAPAKSIKPEPRADEPVATSKPKSKAMSGAAATAKATSLLKQAQALEKAGKTAASLNYYKRIASEFPYTPQARAATARIKALDEK